MPARLRNVCFTLNNPEGLIEFNEAKMHYLVYQEEVGESGTHHFQGYCEFKTQTLLPAVKTMLGGNPHIEARRGTQAQAIAYCKKDDTRVAHEVPHEHGTPQVQTPGKRNDLVAFKEDVMAGKRKRDLVDDHLTVLAKYPKLYDTINSKRPEREETVEVTLLIGPTGLGKTRHVYDMYKGSDDLYIQPLSNGTTWWDTYDGHKIVLIDDFAGAASHMTLTNLLRLLDRYPSLVPTKGSHTWFFPEKIYVTTNIFPRDWYKWEKRTEQYKALARRFSHVIVFQEDADPIEEGTDWWVAESPEEVHYHVPFQQVYIPPDIQN